MNQKKQKIHYAWLILAACCMMQGAGLGLVSNCAGVFYSPVCQDLGFEMGKFSIYRMLFSISSAFAMPFVAKSFRKMDIRVVISAATVVMGGCSIAMGTFTELWQWYAAGIIQGLASSFISMIPAPILLANWFHKKTGFAIGISAAFSGLVGMLGSSGLGFSIPAIGWRASYIMIGVLVMVLILPMSMFVIRYKPEDKNMLAYGAEAGTAVKDSKKSETKEALGTFLREPLFYISVFMYSCSCAGAYVNTYLTSCGISVGMSITTAAMLTTVALFGNMLSKFVLGKASDSFGTIRVFLAATALSLAGLLLLLTGKPQIMLPAAFFYGITMPLSTVMMPLFCKMFWKGDTYAAGYSYVSMFGMLISSPFTTIFGAFYDRTGSYNLTLETASAMLLSVMILVLVGARINKNMEKASSRA
ncbi:MAG: MFS transporter [Lachnospiraceae bacterium]|nr:MFS transporter [Lachnospiraceae bacterium]